MRQKPRTAQKTPYKGPKIKAYVQRNLPNKCPSCELPLSRHLYRINHGNMKNPDGRICEKCHKAFITAQSYYKHQRYFDALNQKEIKPLLDEIELQKQEKHERKMQEKVEKEQAKAALIVAYERKLENSGLLNTPGWKIIKNQIKSMSLDSLKTLVAAFLVLKKSGKQDWYFVTYEGWKSNHISNNMYIIGPECFMGKALIECSAKKILEFRIMDDVYAIKASAVFDERQYAKLLEQYHSGDIVKDEEPQVKRVHVYFSLNIRCVTEEHNVSNVTAKTINIMTGRSVDVNVFYCSDCKQYFINYEVLQGYISKGIYPSFEFSIEDVDESKLREVSELMVYGYNVRDGILSEEERHKILSWIIDSGLLSKAEIIKDLQFKVNYNGKKRGNENAKKKWKDDIQYVSHYVKGNKKRIEAEFYR